MREASDSDLKNRLTLENPWWETGEVAWPPRAWPQRLHFTHLVSLLGGSAEGRVVRLYGPRRVGKTVMLRQAVQHLIDSGVPPRAICHLSLDAPAYDGVRLGRLLDLAPGVSRPGVAGASHLVLDGAQARPGWELQVAALAETRPGLRVLAAASALPMGASAAPDRADRTFADLHLPPLGFAEFVAAMGRREAFEAFIQQRKTGAPEIEALNALLLDYVNHGGFPEAVFAAGTARDRARIIGGNLPGRLWPEDLPRLSAVADTGELLRLVLLLALNAGRELGIEELARSLDVAKNTLRKYLEALEAGFVIRRLDRIDGAARPFRRAARFKAYPVNPSLRAALFGPVTADDPAMGALAETAYLAQFVAEKEAGPLHYARWKDGRIGFVSLDPETRRPAIVTEVTWDDRVVSAPEAALAPLVRFCARNGFETAAITTRDSRFGKIDRPGVYILPTAALIYLQSRTAAADPL
jgi:predicted AAA+ superfamily ATPase